MTREKDELEVPKLSMEEAGLTLVAGSVTLRGDFTRMLPRLRQGNLQRELLVRAAKIKSISGPMVAIDATAGLGEDSILLAAAGYRVHMFEQNPVIAALLRDALIRGAEVPELAGIIGRMELTEGDSITALGNLGESPDLILLDPMFPEKQKNSLTKKKLQLLQRLEGPCSEGESLLEAAIGAEPRRIIIKRPLKGEYLGGRKPNYSLRGKTIRYDCITPVAGNKID